VSAEPSAQLADWDSVRESLARICASHDEFDHFFSGVFEQLDEQLRKGAINRGEQGASGGAESRRQFEQMLEEAQQQRAALRAAQEAAESQTAQLAELTEELSEARDELAEARREIQRQREQLDAVRTGAADREPDQELEERLRQVEKDRAELERERVVLETELDSVRSRAAEMAETVVAQRRQMADERAQWTGELKRMRRVLEMLGRQHAAAAPADAWQEPRVEPRSLSDGPLETVSAAAGSGDPVLGSVMAQFEMLQKDLARRRKKTPNY